MGAARDWWLCYLARARLLPVTGGVFRIWSGKPSNLEVTGRRVAPDGISYC